MPKCGNSYATSGDVSEDDSRPGTLAMNGSLLFHSSDSPSWYTDNIITMTEEGWTGGAVPLPVLHHYPARTRYAATCKRPNYFSLASR